jgi:hypothetical protein
MTEVHSNEETMMIGRLFVLSLAMAGCTAAAYAIGRNTRHLEKRQLKQDLRTWEHEGGNLAPPRNDPSGSPLSLSSNT